LANLKTKNGEFELLYCESDFEELGVIFFDFNDFFENLEVCVAFYIFLVVFFPVVPPEYYPFEGCLDGPKSTEGILFLS